MTWFVVDVETDGPAPGLFSMVSIGAVRVDRKLDTTFYGTTAPLPGAMFQPEALAVSHTTREEHLNFDDPYTTFEALDRWLTQHTLRGEKPTLISDNPAFDGAFVNYYFHRFLRRNPYGFSARRIGDLYAGFHRDTRKHSDWKALRRTPHTHNPVDDARGNAEALITMFASGLEPPTYFLTLPRF